MFGVHYFIRIPSLCHSKPVILREELSCHHFRIEGELSPGMLAWTWKLASAVFVFNFFLSFTSNKIFIQFFPFVSTYKKSLRLLLVGHFVFFFVPLTRLIKLFFLELKILVFEFVFIYLRQLK